MEEGQVDLHSEELKAEMKIGLDGHSELFLGEEMGHLNTFL